MGARKCALLADTVRGWLERGVDPDQIGVAARTGAYADEAVAALNAVGLPAASLARRAAGDGEVSVATMHRMKGLESRAVSVIGVNEPLVPHMAAVTPIDDDPVSHDLDIQRERCLLFVACTRAREELAVSRHGGPSPLLP